MSVLKRPLEFTVCIVSLLFLFPASRYPRQANIATPRLILVISIDQMRFDYLTRFDPLYRGGLRKLLDQGAIFTNARYRHANTETGPGHAVLLSGRHASHSGIVANSWYDPLRKKTINVVDDPVQTPVGGMGRSASPANFLGVTVGDLLKAQSPGSRVVGVSLKDRSAILMAGRRGDAAYWYENENGAMITSSYYTKTAPGWLTNWNKRRYVDHFAGRKWERLLPDESVYEKYAGKDAVEGEWDRKDIAFPHSIRGKPPAVGFYDDFRRTPFADEMILEVALKIQKVHRLGADSTTDLFAIGFSATDVIGHTYGNQSQEIMDQLLRLDLVLEKLFQEIDHRVGLDKTWVVLSADHASMPLVENLREKGIDARRVKASEVLSVVQQALEASFPDSGQIVASFDLPSFYLNEDYLKSRSIKRGDVEQCIIKALMSTGYFDSAYTQAQIMDPEFNADPLLPLIRNSFFQPRSPHIIATPKPYIYISENVGGTGHGTPHEYDRHVPIVFMGARIVAGRYSESCGPEDIAPTLVDLLGLHGFAEEHGFKKENDARVLKEMIRQ